MLRHMCKSKIHRAVVTHANVEYQGSITIDRELMDKADLIPHERVQIANMRSGVRLETYVIEGGAGSGTIGMNGAAARLASVGDEILIMSYAFFEDKEARGLKPKVVFVDRDNHFLRIQ
ncbi:MAG: aspartate 1-decarboxylase [Candidatus Omnitrophica bacterium]|nr:aspartate 1-decarboxylase [Candidatus Omnitrophota bacterium]